MTASATTDVVIIGGGIAGAVLADYLLRSGLGVIMFESPNRAAVSRAAGLISPVAGLRFGVLPQWTTWWEAASSYYEHHGVFDAITCYRLLYNADEIRFWQRKQPMLVDDGLASRVDLPVWLASALSPPEVAIHITPVARIRAGDLLDRLISRLRADGLYRMQTVTDADITIRGESATVCGISCAHVVFCEGAWMLGNNLFAWIPTMFSRGQRISGRIECVQIEHAVWLSIRGKSLVLDGSECFSYGSTYDWSCVEPITTEDSTRHLTTELGRILRVPFHVEQAWAGVRPIVADLRPVIGSHPQWPNVWIFNGLGSRGLLLAPFLAKQLASAIVDKAPLSPQFDVQRFVHSVGTHEHTALS